MFQRIELERKKLQKELPASNGIYRFVRGQEVLYVGKSVNIKARVFSHIESAKLNAKEAAIVNNSDTVEYFVTDNEYKALVLESQQIQKLKPQYNVRWRDDKSYLYIRINLKDEYPKPFLSRKEDDGISRYYGPFPSVRTVQDILKLVRRMFPFCTQKNISKRACFYSKIGLCNPCPNNIEKIEDAEEKKRLKQIYKKNIKRLVKILEGDSESLLKEQYKELKILTAEKKYEEAIVVRDLIYRLDMFLHGRGLDRRDEEVFNQAEVGVKTLQSLLIKFFPDLPLPARIECFDVSNTNQTDGTASMVVMNDGMINKKEYRKFKIKDKTLQSDFDMMKEVIGRRIKQTTWPKADLLVVDGGRPQVRIIQKVLADLEYSIPLIGIAKNPDRIVIGTLDLQTIRPPIRHPGFSLIRSLRDESHRFAKKYHVLLRNKKNL